MSFFDKNISIIKKRNILICPVELNQEIEANHNIKNTESGFPTLVYNQLHFHSSIDPVKEAVTKIKYLSLQDKNFIIVYGSGLWYHIEEISKRKDKDSIIIVIENDPNILTLSFIHRNLSEILERENIIIFSTCNIEDIKNGLKRIIKDKKTPRIEEFIHQPSLKLYPDFYNGIRKQLGIIIQQAWSSTFTRQNFSNLWTRNYILNLRYLKKSVSSLFNKYKDIPCILLAPGPSVINQLNNIKKLREKFLLIVVDSVLRLCLKTGIEPDYVISLDSQYYNFNDFKYFKNANFTLVSDMFSNHLIQEYFNGEIIFSVTGHLEFNEFKSEPVIDWFKNEGLEIGYLQSGGSVLTTAFDFALNLGCNPIIGIGMDLCFVNYVSHAKYSNLDIMALTQSTRLKTHCCYLTGHAAQKGKNIKSYGPDICQTDFIMNNYRNWFEDAATIVTSKIIHIGSPIPLKNWSFLNDISELNLKGKINKYKACEHIDKYLILNALEKLRYQFISNHNIPFLKGMNKIDKIIDCILTKLN